MKINTMKLPRKNKQWAKEALDSLALAHQMVLENDGEEASLTVETIFMLAPYFCTQNRKLNDKQKEKEMFYHVTEEKITELDKFPDEIENYNINFLLTYLDCHLYLKLISEKRHDAIMLYILDNYEI